MPEGTRFVKGSSPGTCRGAVVPRPYPSYGFTAARDSVIFKRGKIGHSDPVGDTGPPAGEAYRDPPEGSPLLVPPDEIQRVFLSPESATSFPLRFSRHMRAKKKPDRYSLGKTQKPKEPPAGPPARSELRDKICYQLRCVFRCCLTPIKRRRRGSCFRISRFFAELSRDASDKDKDPLRQGRR